MRSSVSTSEMYSTSGNPQNSLPVDLSTTRPVSPEITDSASPSLRTTVVLDPHLGLAVLIGTQNDRHARQLL